MLKIEGKKTFAYCDIQDCAEFVGIGGGSPIGAERLRRLGGYIKRVSRKRRVCLCPMHGRPLYEIVWQKQRDARSVLKREGEFHEISY